MPAEEPEAPPTALERLGVARSEKLAKKLAKVEPNDDPALVAGAIAILSAETIARSSSNLREARAYLDSLRIAIDGLLKNAFPHKETTETAEPTEPRDKG